MSLHKYNLRNGPPQKIDVQKLPPGHATFSGQAGKSTGLYVCWGHPYDFSGNRLPADLGWLRDNGYAVDENVQRQLVFQQTQHSSIAPKKHCIECNAEVGTTNKFCPECGSPQMKKLWTPGDTDDDEGNAISRLIDPADPLGSLQAFNEEPEVAETPEEIFKRLTRDEAAVTLRQAGKELNADADLSLTKLSTSSFGTIVTTPQRANQG